jgi:hypothetical protein
VAATACELPFDPARDGFAFPNHFVWSEEDVDHLTAELTGVLAGGGGALAGAAGAIAGGRRALVPAAVAGAVLAAILGHGLVRRFTRHWPEFGLCGGMATAAVERWPTDGGVATSKLARDDIRDLLRRRQYRTLRSAGARFVWYWLGTRLLGGPSLAPPFGAALVREVETARLRIDAGRPVILGLVGDAPDPFEMHQVVAFGYREVPAPGPGSESVVATRFDVYDPNAPGERRHVTAGITGDRTNITTDLPTGPRRRGFHLSTVQGRLGMVFVVD